MAKVKIYVLAKEIGIQSREILDFLQGKGIEAKAANSSIEENDAQLVRKHFQTGVKADSKGKEEAGVRTADSTKEKTAETKKSVEGTEGMEERKPEEKHTAVRNDGGVSVDKPLQKGMDKEAGGEVSAGKEDRAKTENTAAAVSQSAGKAQVTDKAQLTDKTQLTERSQSAGKTQSAGNTQAGEKTQAGKDTPQAGKDTPQAGKDTPKKKKKIIVVSNPYNSKMSGGQRPQSQGNARSGGDRKQQGGSGARNTGSQGMRQGGRSNVNQVYRPIKPLTAPSQPETYKPEIKSSQPARKPAAERTVSNEKNTQARSNIQQPAGGQQGRQERSAQERRSYSPAGGTDRRPESQNRQAYNSGANSRPGGQNSRPGGQNSRPGSQNSRPGSQNSRPGSQNSRPGNQGSRPGGGNTAGGSRPYANNDRGARGNAGTDNKFRKPAPGKGFVPEPPAKDTEKRRDDDKRRGGQEKDKRSKKDMIYEDDNAKLKNKNKAGRFIKPEKRADEEKEEQIKVITVPDTLTIKELADKMKLQPSAIIKKLFLKGQIVTVNSEITFEEAENIAIDYEIICEREVKVDVIEELLKEDEDNEETMVKRAPVICVMGHVDHGKTSLLDAIRKTNVTDKEAGGITQHIGAYTVNINGQTITFLDTPGHEAFTAMRMRGANSTDIAILVVAADDGVMPQTVEAINHAKAAGIEIVVAVNKVDKPNANIDRVKQELTEYELIPVDWGGSTEFVPVSAKTGEGIESLLETILLTAEILELKANPNRRARGLVIEAELDKGRGPVATVLVQKGTLHVGDFISAGASHGKVRAMIDDKGRRIKEAIPSTPVEILGLSDVPNAGEVFISHDNDKTAKSYADTYLAQNKEKMLEDTKAKMSLDDLFTKIQAGNLKELDLIIKADVQGSVEAVKQSLLKLSNEEIVVKCIHGGVGAITESDVSLASASQAIIIGFNVRPDAMAKTVAEREGVDIRLYKVIYQAIEDVEAAMKGMLDPIYEEKVIGHAEVRQIFKASAVGNIAGSYVLDGEFQRNSKIRITREGEQIYEGQLASLKRFKDDVKEVKAGFECGLVFDGFDQMQELDIVEAYIMVEVPR